ncbi:DUF4428 domain-containing protein [Porcincola sp. LCP21S3_C12]|uniref:DUF4428 domain-containing protein n=1 Tax=Porcincola sp. LCP21S3_C12 TaxID=3438798 RepID=UPI003F9AB0B1
MGLFGKMFEKKECSICGGEIGLLGNRKLADGNLCKNCAKKLSPWFKERRQSTVEDIRRQLDYREMNKEAVRAFQVTRDVATDRYHVFVDMGKGQFTVASKLDEQENPDIVSLSQVTGCRLEVKEDRDEEKYEDSDGNMKSYVPPHYKYSYDYVMHISVNSPWFDNMDFQMNLFSVKDHERGDMMAMEQAGNEIVALLTGGFGAAGAGYPGSQAAYGNPAAGGYGGVPGGAYGQPNGMYGAQNPGGAYGQPNGMYGVQNPGGAYGQPNGMYGVQNPGGAYGQPNGMYGVQNPGGAYGQPSGAYGGQGGAYGAVVRCDKCGWTSQPGAPVPSFCPECGDPITQRDLM